MRENREAKGGKWQRDPPTNAAYAPVVKQRVRSAKR